MRSHLVVFATPLLDVDAGFDAISKPLHVEALVAKLPVEALVGAILPGLARCDEGGLNADTRKPPEHGERHELRAVVRTQGAWRASFTDERFKHLDDATGTNAPGDIDGKCFMGPLVDDGEALELLPIRTRIEDKVVGPHLIGPCRRMGSRPRRRETPPPPFLRDLKARLLPQSVCAPRAHRQAIAPKQDANASIAPARVARGQLVHPRDRRGVLDEEPRFVAKRRASHAQEDACAPT